MYRAPNGPGVQKIVVFQTTDKTDYGCCFKCENKSKEIKPNDTTVTARIAACLADISAWMKEHHIQLNSAKTELLVFPANPAVEHNITVQLGPTTVSPSKTVRNLGVTIDDELNFTDHISKTARSCRFTLDNIRKIRSFLSVHATQLLVQSPCHN
ncbi:uncharacterized protein LOC127641702 isoform X2 [Xyrauchen texanus]|uniref:uncharacterized protein LOC127641702 isoform X2 n=1 Tax=Xyrauchen texanus TaxID=154827 RepID=UPI0022422371|nr:uncharacterized protein LOC127641702 isoform X2 [Xyrauchen texanus]